MGEGVASAVAAWGVSVRWARSGSKGEADGEEIGLSEMGLLLIGKVKARGVGVMIDKVGVC